MGGPIMWGNGEIPQGHGPVKYRDLIRVLEEAGWQHVRTSGSHRVYRHQQREGIVVVAVHLPGNDVPKGLLSAIMRQAGLRG